MQPPIPRRPTHLPDYTEKRKVFSFQIAKRSVQLHHSISAPWVDILLDSFPDLLASKMVALVERGAPRDFRDIYAVCQAALTTINECWYLWQNHLQAAGNEVDLERARLAIETHLERIEQNRPLDQISDTEQRVQAQSVRKWYREQFLNAKLA